MLSLLAPFGAPLVQEIPFPGSEGAAPPTQWKDAFRAVATQQEHEQQAAMVVCVSVPPYQTAANDQWCAQSCNRDGLKTKTCSSTICKCGGSELRLSPDGEQHEEEEDDEEEDGGAGCQRYVSSGGATTDEWCASYCATDEGCPPDVADVCKCADDMEMTAEEQQREQKAKEQFASAGHDFTTTWTEQQGAQNQEKAADTQEVQQAKQSQAAVIKQEQDMLRQRRGMQQAADAAVLGMPAPAQRTQQQYQQQQQQQASLQPEQSPSEQQATYEDGLPMCVSITVDTTNGACQRACASPEGCPAELKASCKCGDEAIDNLDKVRSGSGSGSG